MFPTVSRLFLNDFKGSTTSGKRKHFRTYIFDFYLTSVFSSAFNKVFFVLAFAFSFVLGEKLINQLHQMPWSNEFFFCVPPRCNSHLKSPLLPEFAPKRRQADPLRKTFSQAFFTQISAKVTTISFRSR